MMRRGSLDLGGWALGALAVLAVACGGHEAEAPHPTGHAIVGPSAGKSKASRGPDQAPVIASVKLSPEVPVIGAEIKAVVEASDPDGDPIRLQYVWLRNGTEVSEGNQPLVLIPEIAKGDRIEVRVTASDGQLESEPAGASATVGDRPPVLSAVTLQPFGDVRPGQVITADPQAADPDNDPMTFTYTWTVNGQEEGHDRTFDTHGLKRGDQVQVRVVASDGSAESREVKSNIQLMGNSPPVIKQLPTAQVSDGTFRYAFQAEDPDGDQNLRFFLAKAPAGMEIDPVTGVLTWHPDASQAGVHPVEVGVKDPSGEGTTFLFQVTVAAKVTKAGAPPAAAAPPSREEE
jgi:hypothetical protein